MQTITTAEVAELVATGRPGEAVVLAYAVLSERFEQLPDGGDALFGDLFTPDECQALDDALELARFALQGRF